VKVLAVVVLRVVQFGIGGRYQHPVSGQSVRYALDTVSLNAMPRYDFYYPKFMEVLGRPDLVGDPRFFPQSALDEFYEVIREGMARKNLDEWIRLFTEADLPFAVAQTWSELLKDPQAWGSDCFYEMGYPTGAKRTLVRTPVMFTETPLPEYKRGPYPGEQTEAILSGLGYHRVQSRCIPAGGL